MNVGAPVQGRRCRWPDMAAAPLSSGVAVLVDEPAAGGVLFDRWAGPGCDGGDVVGWALVQRAVGPMLVVVVDVLAEQSAELALVPDDRPVQQFVAHGAHPPLRERVGSSAPEAVT